MDHLLTEKSKTFKVLAETPERIDKYLHLTFPDYSRNFFQELIAGKLVILNGKEVTKKTNITRGDEITITIPEKNRIYLPSPEDFNYKILYEDEDLLVIDKPPGVVVHPATGNYSGTVVNALLGKDKKFLENLAEYGADELSLSRPGIVHRLDKDTSGCLIVAKNIVSKAKISASFASRQVTKIYKAIVIGQPQKSRGKIETLIGRNHIQRQKMAVVSVRGREAITIYELIKTFRRKDEILSLLNVQILTGRTHQIRVHLAHKKLPILGDAFYGGKQRFKVQRQMLHAWKLEFPHPSTKQLIQIECPLPDDFIQIIE